MTRQMEWGRKRRSNGGRSRRHMVYFFFGSIECDDSKSRAHNPSQDVFSSENWRKSKRPLGDDNHSHCVPTGHRWRPTIQVVRYKRLLSLNDRGEIIQAWGQKKKKLVVYCAQIATVYFKPTAMFHFWEAEGLKRRNESRDKMLKVHNKNQKTKKQNKLKWQNFPKVKKLSTSFVLVVPQQPNVFRCFSSSSLSCCCR